MPPRRAGSKRTGGGGGGGGGEGATERLLQQIKEGQGYEALQTARALFARQEGQGKSGQARTMALALAKAYAETGEYKSVLDLARLYMANNTTQTKTSKQSNNNQPQVMEVSAAEANKLTSSSTSPPPPADPTMTPHHFTTQGRDNMLALAASLPAGSTEKIALLKGVSRWSLEETGRTLTDTHLGLALAGAYREAGEYGQAANKFTQMAALVEVEEEEGGKGKEEMEKLAKMYAELLKEWSLQGYVGEKDLFVARAVLQLVVCGGNATQKGPTLAYARALLTATLATAEAEKDTQLTDSPLLHYLSVLLDLIDAHIKTPTPTHTSPRSPTLLPPTSELFRLLTSRYQPVLERDPSFPQATQKIGEMYFNILPPQNPMQALLQSMMGAGGGGGGLLGSMLGGGAGGGGGLLGALGGMGNLGL